jgi:alpha-tubulin suppressor-like RCC1 family protein
LSSAGFVRAWGNNDYGQTNVPAGLSNVVAVSAGCYHSLGLRADGTVVAWGAGTNYNGNDQNFGQAAVPASLSHAVQIGAGAFHSVALKSDGTVAAWGDNYFGQTNVPAGLTNVVAVASGVSFCLALKADGTVIGWGEDTFGEIEIPASLSNVIAFASGANGESSLALVGDGPPVQHSRLLNPASTGQGFSVAVPSQSGRV